MSNITNRRQFLQWGFLCALQSATGPFFPYHTEMDMLKRAIPSSRELLPAIGLGTWRQFDVNPSGSEGIALKAVLNTLVKQSPGSMIDSSPMYGYSESCIGELSEQLNQRRSFFFASKVWVSGRSEGINQIDHSFKKFRAQQMDLMQVHNLVDVKTQLKTLFELKAEGRVRYVGVTHYLPSAYPEIIRIMKNDKIDFVQCCYNIRVPDAEKELLPFARDKGIAVIINRPFEEGQLFDGVKNKKLPEWAREYGIGSWAQYFLKYILAHPAVTCIIPGT